MSGNINMGTTNEITEIKTIRPPVATNNIIKVVQKKMGHLESKWNIVLSCHFSKKFLCVNFCQPVPISIKNRVAFTGRKGF